VETDPRFPDGTNVEFVAFSAPGAIRLRVWERGVGETRACGTGMAAAAAVAGQTMQLDEIAVSVPGGDGHIRFADGVAWLSGPAEFVFAGAWPGGLSEPS
jgi:diaminopimelate epimerase